MGETDRDSSNEVRNQQVLLARHPEGIAGPGDFEIVETPMPSPGDGQFLVEAHYVGLDAALRLIVRDTDEFLFRVRPGDLVHGSSVGRVVESNHPGFGVGDAVMGSFGVQRFAVSDGQGAELCDESLAPLSSWLGGFGNAGLTAYFALYDACRVQPGQTVVVNGAAGAVGSMAGQFAKLASARTIGLAGTAEKCEWLVSELGYDVAICYRDADWFAQLERACPDGIDVVFDNVGGDVMNDSLKLLALNSIVLLCGSTSQYSQAEMVGPSNYIWLGTMRARLQGFVVFDYADRFPIARKRMSEWLATNRLKLPEHRVYGTLDEFPGAFRGLYEGENLGKMVLALPASES